MRPLCSAHYNKGALTETKTEFEVTYLLRELISVHPRLKAVTKVNVQQFISVPINHEVAGMPVP